MSREEKILDILSESKKIEVNELAKILSVSEVTIRKDLDKLSERGIVKREHGYAVLGTQEDLNYRLAICYNEKKRIAKMAATLVEDGETIIIDSGSTCALLAEEIVTTKENVTIIMNSAFIANYIRKYRNCEIILLGGIFQQDAQVSVGPITKNQLSNLNVDKFFVGIDGYEKSKGFMGTDLMRVEVAQNMSQSAQHTILLTDSSKFSEKGNVLQYKLSEVNMIYTDNKIDDKLVKDFQKNGLKVNIV